MRTIAIEEHFLASGFREALQRNASGRQGANGGLPLQIQAKLADNASISPSDKEKISHLNAEQLLKIAEA